MEINSREVNLKIDSRIITHLGEALIDNEKIALLELIKNSSDADANNCNIEIDTSYKSQYGKGRIIIEDDGNGMTPFIIENAFLKIATSFKVDHQKISPKFKRQAQGNKGIGRLSLNQLGRFISVDTKVDTDLTDFFSDEEIYENFGYPTKQLMKKNNEKFFYHLEIDWENYNVSSKTVESVKLELQTSIFNDMVFSHKKSHGTRIEVLGLKGIDFWRSSQTQKEIELDILEFLNPYLDERYNFYVTINLDNKKFTSDKYDLSDIENNYLSKADFTFDSKTSLMNLNITRSKKYIDYKVDELIKKLKGWDLDLIDEKPIRKYYEYWSHNSLTFDLSSIESANLTTTNVRFDRFIKYTDNILSDKGKMEQEKFFLPGDFKGVIYGFDFSAGSPISKRFRKVMEEIRGVKLYRNNFRIFPYGSKNDDWLKMSDYNLRNKGVIFKQHSSTGFINIDGEDNLKRLKELTNRQGLLLDNYGTNFILIVQEIVYKNIAKSDRIFTEYFDFRRKEVHDLKENQIIEIAGMHFKKNGDKIAETEEKLNNLLANFNKLENNERVKEVESIRDSAANLKNIVTLKEYQVAEIEKHLEEFAPIMGATIIAETLSHEIIRLSNNIKTHSLKARKALKNDDKEEALTNILRIDSSNKFLSRYASILDVNSFSRRRKYTVKSIKSKLEEVLKDSPLLTYGNTTIEYSIIGTDFHVEMIEDSFKIIIENMIINSTYWLDKIKINNPCINFELNAVLGKLIIFDNGLGIDKYVEKYIFEEFVTNKPEGDGRGMGLYIVTTLLNEIGATIRLEDERNEYGNLFKFVITFPEVGA